MNLFHTQIPVDRCTPTKFKGDKAICLPDFVFMEHYKNYSLENIIEEINGIVYVEQWKPINGYELLYSISNFGRVRQMPTFKKLPTGKMYLTKIKMMHIHRDKRYGYCQLELTKDGVGKTRKVHRLEAIAFLPNPENLPQVNHIDGVKINNYISNLEWTNNSLNQLHAYKLGLNKQKSGEQHHNSKLSDLQVIEIKSKHLNGKSAYSLAKIFNVSAVTIGRVVKNKRNGK